MLSEHAVRLVDARAKSEAWRMDYETSLRSPYMKPESELRFGFHRRADTLHVALFARFATGVDATEKTPC